MVQRGHDDEQEGGKERAPLVDASVEVGEPPAVVEPRLARRTHHHQLALCARHHDCSRTV